MTNVGATLDSQLLPNAPLHKWHGFGYFDVDVHHMNFVSFSASSAERGGVSQLDTSDRQSHLGENSRHVRYPIPAIEAQTVADSGLLVQAQPWLVCATV